MQRQAGLEHQPPRLVVEQVAEQPQRGRARSARSPGARSGKTTRAPRCANSSGITQACGSSTSRPGRAAARSAAAPTPITHERRHVDGRVGGRDAARAGAAGARPSACRHQTSAAPAACAGGTCSSQPHRRLAPGDRPAQHHELGVGGQLLDLLVASRRRALRRPCSRPRAAPRRRRRRCRRSRGRPPSTAASSVCPVRSRRTRRAICPPPQMRKDSGRSKPRRYAHLQSCSPCRHGRPIPSDRSTSTPTAGRSGAS